MKRAALIFAFIIAALWGCAPYEKSDTKNTQFFIDNTHVYLENFLTGAGADRTAGSDGEKAAADYLQAFFEGLGFETERQKFDIPGEKKSQNIIATKPGATNGGGSAGYKVIVGAHYDNSYDLPNIESKAEGAYDNGSGVAVMMAIADYVSAAEEDYPFDIEFVAFGAEEPGLLGSEHYVKEMSRFDKDATLLMINLDSIGGGDYLYMYADEVATSYEDFFHEVAGSISAPLNRPPANKKVFYVPTEITPYSHYGLASDNLSFMREKIKCVSFFSVNWSTNLKTGMIESEKHKAVMHTKNDTLENIKAMYGDSYKIKMDVAASVIVAAFGDNDFVSTMQNSRVPDYSLLINPNLHYLIKLGVLVAVYIFVRLMSMYFDKKHPLIIPKSRPPKVVVFEGYEDDPKNPFKEF